MKVKIANPIYDAAFKFLMEDTEVAQILLSDLIQEEIIDLEFKPKEYTIKTKIPGLGDKTLTFYRLDYKATIRTKYGTKVVLIEIQKARMGTESQRFRSYLGEQYASAENLIITERGKIGLPIISIYFLGYELGTIENVPVIRTKHFYFDNSTGERIDAQDEFIESLTHDTIVVQLPILHKIEPRTDFENVLTIFEPGANRLYVEIDENLFPEKYRKLIKRLKMATTNPHITKQMQIEDEILWAFKFKDEQIKKALREKQKIFREKQKILREKELLFNEKLELARKTARLMKQLGYPLEQIAKETGLPISEILKL